VSPCFPLFTYIRDYKKRWRLYNQVSYRFIGQIQTAILKQNVKLEDVGVKVHIEFH